MLKKIVHTLFVVLLYAIVFPTNLMADNGRTKIVRSNWPSEYMGTNRDLFDFPLNPSIFDTGAGTTNPGPMRPIESYGIYTGTSTGTPCIKPSLSGEIQIGLFFVVKNSIYDAGCLPIYLEYTVGNTSGILSESQMDQTYASYYAADGNFYAGDNITFHKTITVDLSDLYNNGFGGSFNYGFELVTADGSLYPIDNYPDLFFEYNYADTNIFYSPTQLEGTKPFCYLISGLTSVQTDNPTTRAATKSIEKEEDSFGSDNKPMFSSPKMEQLEVFPNPFHDEINISNIDDDINIRVVDINGRLIYKEHIDLRNIGSTIKIDTNTWSKGLYFCQLESATEVKVVKLYK